MFVVELEAAQIDEALPVIDEVEDTATDLLRRIEITTVDGTPAWAYHYPHGVDGLGAHRAVGRPGRPLSRGVTETRHVVGVGSLPDSPRWLTSQVPAVAPVHLDTAALEAGLDDIRGVARRTTARSS